MFRCLAVALAAVISQSAFAADWKSTEVLPAGSVQKSADLPLIKQCNGAVCTPTKTKAFAAPTAAPDTGLPDGEVAQFDGTIKAAWYEMPTKRYGHGILGDAIEAGELVVELKDGTLVRHTLPDNQVFEDRTPRIIDLDGFGEPEVVTILSDIELGASVAVFHIKDGKLELAAQTPPIGRSNRWLNIAGIEDFDGDGSLQIAAVETPHIGGTLKFWSWKPRNTKSKLVLSGKAHGFSNHFIGSREQRLSAVEDFNGDGVADLALPGNNRKSLHLLTVSKGAVEVIASVSLPQQIDKAISTKFMGDAVLITVGLSDGSVHAVHQ